MRKYLIVIIVFFYCFISVNIPYTYADKWTPRSNFGGVVRYGATGFSISIKGYIGIGYDGSLFYKDFWEYDSSANTWTQKADFAGAARYGASDFPSGAWATLEQDMIVLHCLNDFWEYDPSDK